MPAAGNYIKKIGFHQHRLFSGFAFLTIMAVTTYFCFIFANHKQKFNVFWSRQEYSENYLPSTLPITDVRTFLVKSEKCKIPYIDPLHHSIRQYIDYSKPLICAQQVPLTRTTGQKLILDKNAMLSRNISNISCCYKNILRGEFADSNVIFSECSQFTDEVDIEVDFISAHCNYDNGTEFYQEYHSFIHDKPSVEQRFSKNIDERYSVLIIGIDSISRLNMHRQLKEMHHYLINEMGAIEMLGYNKVGDNTFPNLIPVLTGYNETELLEICLNRSWDHPLDNCTFVWKRYAENGYRTLYAEDAPQISTFNYLKGGFLNDPTDYYFRPFIKIFEDMKGWFKILNTYGCVGSISETELVLEWTEKFALHFKKRSYFAFSWINSLSHDFINTVSAGDHAYKKFFRQLHKSGALNRTIVIVMSDHGHRFGELRKTYVGWLEDRLPMLLVALPTEFKSKFPKHTKNLLRNSRKLTTPFDLHATLVHILKLNETDDLIYQLDKRYADRVFSLLDVVPDTRSCDDAFIEPHFCTCDSTLPAAKKKPFVEKAARFLVSHLNQILDSVKDICEHLSLHFIANANFIISGSKNRQTVILTIETVPGNAVFEGTVNCPSEAKCEMAGPISRLNLYGNQSHCVNNSVIKKYCYCIDQYN